jgi:heparin/heparan-sulfate lyase
MQAEVMPWYWNSGPAPGEEDRAFPNDGGQCRVIGSKGVAFETHDEYAYVAGDATEGYHPEKCRLALRQFVFVPPDYFVVFDRVCSTGPEARKTWLLHTAREPIIRQNVFSADQEEGRLFCRTILPEGAKLARVGGAGKQFWSGGRNWSLPEGFRAPETTELLGQWRVEVTPIEQKEEDLFLHLIQVGDASLKTMVQSELVREDDRIGVRFPSGHKEWEIVFGAKGPPSGRIIVKEAGTRTIVRELIGIESGKVRK